jgi:hypothetical protein
MNLPGFTAEASLGPSRRTYHGKFLSEGSASQAHSGVPAGVLPNELEGVEDLNIGGETTLTGEMDIGSGAELVEEMGAGEVEGEGVELVEELG